MTHADVIVFPAPTGYADATRLQAQLVDARQADRIPDVILALEHTPVITLGIRARQEHVLLPVDLLKQRGIDVEETPRGGDVTYHAPGQLVLYPVLKLAGAEADAHAYVTRLEEAAIMTARHYGLDAWRRPGKTGAWTSAGKLAAIGVRIRRWVTSHGISFNVNVDLSGFSLIIPCGLHGEPVTSLQALLGPACPPIPEVRHIMLDALAGQLNRTLATRDFMDFAADFNLRAGPPA